MSKFFKRTLGLLVLLSAVLTLTSCGQKNQPNVYQNSKKANKIVWGVKSDTKLFGLVNIKSGETEGFDIDIAKALTKKILGQNGKVEFVATTAKTKVPLLKNNSIDAVAATMTITPEREKILDFSNPYFGAGQSILVKKESKIKNISDLNQNGVKVMAVKGTTAVENIHKYAPKAKVLELDDYAQAFSALKSGQGVAMTTDNGILFGIAKENPNYHVVGGAFTNEPYGLAVDKGQTEMRNHINKALSEIKADGTYTKLVKKWFGNIPGFNLKEVEE